MVYPTVCEVEKYFLRSKPLKSVRLCAKFLRGAKRPFFKCLKHGQAQNDKNR
uniref:Candidate secreted effector n=1 Tax=Meloidogyne incognita TaxID=6306 RepID=A0A914L906_MELIC